MRLCMPFGMVLAAALVIAGCGAGDDASTETGRRLEVLARESAALAGRTAPPAERAAADRPGTGAGESAAGDPAGGSADPAAVLSEEHRPELAYTRRYYAYRSAKHRDPFEPLLTEGGEVDGITLSALTLTGILWDAEESLIVLEDSRGRGYPLRVGDRLAGARLVAVRKDAAVFRVVEFGESRSIVKELFTAEETPI